MKSKKPFSSRTLQLVTGTPKRDRIFNRTEIKLQGFILRCLDCIAHVIRQSLIHWNRIEYFSIAVVISVFNIYRFLDSKPFVLFLNSCIRDTNWKASNGHCTTHTSPRMPLLTDYATGSGQNEEFWYFSTEKPCCLLRLATTLKHIQYTILRDKEPQSSNAVTHTPFF